MKKIFSLFVFALGCLTLASCSDDDFTEKVNSVAFSTESSTIPSVGGSVVFNVTGTGLTATSAADWLTVSLNGQTITATAASNPSRESRATHITVKASNGDTQLLSVIQSGIVIGIEKYRIDATDAAADFTVGYQADAAATVKSLAEWITASVDPTKSVFNISVASNDDAKNRIGMVEFACAGVTDTLYVFQEAMVFSLEATSLNFSNEGGSQTVAIEHSKPVTVETNVDWVECKFDNKTNNLTVTVGENPGLARQGTISVKSANTTKTISVIQYDPASLGDQMFGDYYFLFIDAEDGEEGGVYAKLTENALVLPALNWSIPVTIDKEKLTVTINSGNFVGTYNYSGTLLYMYLLFVEETGQYWSANSTDYTVTAKLGLEDIGDGELTLAGAFEGVLKGSKITDFLFSAFIDQTLDVNGDGYLGDLAQWSSVTLMKVPEEAEARGVVSKRSMQVSKKFSSLKKHFKK